MAWGRGGGGSGESTLADNPQEQKVISPAARGISKENGGRSRGEGLADPVCDAEVLYLLRCPQRS